ncbi:MAG: transcription antitermination factor NusB [Spirochaetaceae bacterium]|jgi:N utilization substance protein B|nr:transcription antitermination factor NusB [Spirochaetaceae bacterium]
MASRRKGRILAIQALYSWEVKKGSPGDALDLSWLEPGKQEALGLETVAFSRLLVSGTIENIKAVDAMIRDHLKRWDFSRIKRVDLSILRVSVYTLMYQTDIHPSIVIQEAIELCNEFGTDESYRFVNGILDGIRKTLQEKG